MLMPLIFHSSFGPGILLSKVFFPLYSAFLSNEQFSFSVTDFSRLLFNLELHFCFSLTILKRVRSLQQLQQNPRI